VTVGRRPTTGAAADSSADSLSSRGGLPQVDPEKLFENAFRDMRMGKYDLAVMQFEEYIGLFGSGEQADEAQYWLGECYYAKEEFDKAIPELEKVEQRYPKSEMLVSSLYKLARSHEELGHKKIARSIFERIVNDYPDAFEAGTARKRLEGL
jgi:tol-pal system protein YbgF